MIKSVLLSALFFIAGLNHCMAQFSSPSMIKIAGGRFIMGEGNDRYGLDAKHVVELKTFYLASTETTVAVWKEFCKDTGEKMPEAPRWGWQDQHPMVNVSLNNVLKFIEWLNKKTGKAFRLPTEAEWEFAAKGGIKQSSDIFSGGNEVNKVAWYALNSNNQTQQVATKKSNALGLFDMTGNVAEWCQDRYTVYTKKAVNNPKGADNGFFRIVRGGSWYNLADYSKNTFRTKLVAGAKFDYLGFRLAADTL